jgi:uncharacterized protein
VTFLLDVNVLVALIDPAHVAHEAAHAWFAAEGARSWATCPITENGVLRILGNPKYPNSPGAPSAVAPILERMRALPGHVFWADEISLIGGDLVDAGKIATHAQVTDVYLLALAVAKHGKLATFDRRISASAVLNGRGALAIIPG